MRVVPMWSGRASARVFLLAACCAFGTWLLLSLSTEWFVLDEFDYIGPQNGEPRLEWLVTPHNEHTIVFTKWWFSTLYSAVGLEHYWLYGLPLVAGHLALVAAVYHLLSRSTGSAWFASLSSMPVLVMGGASGTLTWAGQAQYTWPIALGAWSLALVVRDRQGPSVPLVTFAGLALLGTLSGSAFLPYGVVGGAALVWWRRPARGMVLAGIPAAWFVVSRMIWEVPSTNSAQSVSQVLREGPSYGWAVVDKAVSDTVLVTGLTAVIVAFVGWGIVKNLHGYPSGSIETARQRVVLLLVAAEIATIGAVTVGRLNYDSVPNGGHSYLVLSPFLPLLALAAYRLVRASRRGFRTATAAACAYVVAISLATIAANVQLRADDGDRMRTTLQASAALAMDPEFEVLDPQTAPEPSAPTFTWSDIRSAAASGALAQVVPSQETVDSISLFAQWAAVPSPADVSACERADSLVALKNGDVLVAEDKPVALTIRYPGSAAGKVVELSPGIPLRLESTSGRMVEGASTHLRQLRVCPAATTP